MGICFKGCFATDYPIWGCFWRTILFQVIQSDTEFGVVLFRPLPSEVVFRGWYTSDCPIWSCFKLSHLRLYWRIFLLRLPSEVSFRCFYISDDSIWCFFRVVMLQTVPSEAVLRGCYTSDCSSWGCFEGVLMLQYSTFYLIVSIIYPKFRTEWKNRSPLPLKTIHFFVHSSLY
jgi:hypothetical protein